ncbi:unnamed protein product [Protopolystoma xenopodis]|uniref:Uncharacterized protein n=1 Tax=Protopolystoma xenopodis TaxID=117903 RepID=A0A3S5CNS6_9PLAT|nr:unnamed protein product [Protopolystoma xenopodis]
MTNDVLFATPGLMTPVVPDTPQLRLGRKFDGRGRSGGGVGGGPEWVGLGPRSERSGCPSGTTDDSGNGVSSGSFPAGANRTGPAEGLLEASSKRTINSGIHCAKRLPQAQSPGVTTSGSSNLSPEDSFVRCAKGNLQPTNTASRFRRDGDSNKAVGITTDRAGTDFVFCRTDSMHCLCTRLIDGPGDIQVDSSLLSAEEARKAGSMKTEAEVETCYLIDCQTPLVVGRRARRYAGRPLQRNMLLLTRCLSLPTLCPETGQETAEATVLKSANGPSAVQDATFQLISVSNTNKAVQNAPPCAEDHRVRCTTTSDEAMKDDCQSPGAPSSLSRAALLSAVLPQRHCSPAPVFSKVCSGFSDPDPSIAPSAGSTEVDDHCADSLTLSTPEGKPFTQASPSHCTPLSSCSSSIPSFYTSLASSQLHEKEGKLLSRPISCCESSDDLSIELVASLGQCSPPQEARLTFTGCLLPHGAGSERQLFLLTQ